jgi:cytochrome c-type biogenesis protein CcmH
VVRGAALLLLVALLGAVAPTVGAEPAETPYSYDLWTGLMSPYCPGRTLADCPSSQAAELRQWIREQEAAGRSRADVEDQLYARFGDIILQTPRASGFGLAAYAIPVLAFLVGGGLVVFFLRRQVRTRGGAPVSPPAVVDPELERLLDRELDQT